MSNQQWESDQGPQTWPNVPQTQPSASGWGRPEVPEPAGQGWAQPNSSQSAQEWSQPSWNPPATETPSSASWGQPQQTTNDWQQQPAQGWTQPPAPQQSGQQPTPDWQAQQSTQQWAQPAAQQPAPQQQGWNQATSWGQPAAAVPPVPVESKPSPFDFSVKKLSLPGSAGLIFLLGSIGLAVEWFAGFIAYFAAGYTSPGAGFLQLLSGLGGLVVKVLVLRVLVEIGVAATRLLGKDGKSSEDDGAAAA